MMCECAYMVQKGGVLNLSPICKMPKRNTEKTIVKKMIKITKINYFSNMLVPGANPEVLPYGYEISDDVDIKNQLCTDQ